MTCVTAELSVSDPAACTWGHQSMILRLPTLPAECLAVGVAATPTRYDCVSILRSVLVCTVTELSPFERSHTTL